MAKHKFPLIMILSIIFSCTDSGPEPVFVVPENLSFSVENRGDGSGYITVTATADNAFSYKLYHNETVSADPVIDKSGNLTYRYTNSGDYTIEVRAVGNGGDFISEKEDIKVVVDGSLIIPSSGYSTPESYSGMTLLWQDEFDATTLNESYWNYELGTGSNGWGNNELQYYREENTSIIDGHLVIEAKKENFDNNLYTSSRLTTENKFEFQYGRVDIRAALPKGQGIWPALWMLGANFSDVGWPKCGEIDIMEMIGGSGRENNVYGTLHWYDDDSGLRECTCGEGDHTLSSGTFADQFHVFTLIWNEGSIEWHVDDSLYHTSSISPAEMDEFREKFFFIFNIAVGGDHPGSPDESTAFPQRMIVDYVRVFQQ